MLLGEESDVRAELVRRLGRDPDPAIWSYLREHNYVSTAIQDSSSGLDSGFTELERAYRELEQLRGTRPARLEHSGQHRRPHEVETGLLEETLSEIVETDAPSHFPLLPHFRVQIGFPIPPTGIAEWVESRLITASASAGPSMWIEVPVEVPEAGLPRADEILRYLQAELGRMLDAPEWRLGRYRVETLIYPSADGQEIIRRALPRVVAKPGEEPPPALRAFRELEVLKRVAGELVDSFPGWNEAEAVTFALSGRAPIPRRALSFAQSSSIVPAMGRVSLHVSPLAEPDEVVALFRSVRAEMLGADERVRTPSETAIALAQFINHANGTGLTWQAAMREWNSQGTGKQYRDWRLFARDAKRFYRQVTGGLELQWRSKSETTETGVTAPEKGGTRG